MFVSGIEGGVDFERAAGLRKGASKSLRHLRNSGITARAGPRFYSIAVYVSTSTLEVAAQPVVSA